jgi:hypothetical protein
MFRPLLAIFRWKSTIIILGSYLNYNGSVGFYWVLFIVYVVVAYLITFRTTLVNYSQNRKSKQKKLQDNNRTSKY